MLFLLPPSETKRIGGSQPNISQISQTFGALTQSRHDLIEQLVAKAEGPNKHLWNAETMPAIERFSGTLFEALDFLSLPEAAKQRTRETVLIQTALFGLVSAADRIPNYRLAAGASGFKTSLRQHWNSQHRVVFERLRPASPLIDLRSKAYVELAEIPTDIEHYWVEVMARNSTGQAKALNHFNKKAKGEFVRAAMLSKSKPESIGDLKKIARKLDFDLELADGQLKLIIPGN